MAPDSRAALIAALAASVVTAALAALVWPVARRGWWRWPVRVAAIVLCAATAASAGLLEVNHEISIYTTWAEVFGGRPPPAAPQSTVESVSGAGSRVIEFTVPGQASGITLPAYAYLPAGYDSTLGHRSRYPVVEAFDGFPGSPNSWLRRLDVAAILDTEIAAHRMAPTVVVFPYQTLNSTHDSECVDAVGGAKYDTFLTVDVPATVERLLRVRSGRVGWGAIGYSAGGFCAVNLAMRHPDRYAAAASLSGYFEPLVTDRTGDLYRGSAATRDQNNPLWRARNMTQPSLALYLGCARDDRSSYLDQLRFAAAIRPPMSVTTALVPRGGHTKPVWEDLEPPAFDWLSSWLAAPTPVGAS